MSVTFQTNAFQNNAFEAGSGVTQFTQALTATQAEAALLAKQIAAARRATQAQVGILAKLVGHIRAIAQATATISNRTVQSVHVATQRQTALETRVIAAVRFATQAAVAIRTLLVAHIMVATQGCVALLARSFAFSRVATQAQAVVSNRNISKTVLAVQAETVTSTRIISLVHLALQAQVVVLQSLKVILRTLLAVQAQVSVLARGVLAQRVAVQAESTSLGRAIAHIRTAEQRQVAVQSRTMALSHVATQTTAVVFAALKLILRTLLGTQAAVASCLRTVMPIRVATQAAPAVQRRTIAATRVAIQGQSGSIRRSVSVLFRATQAQASAISKGIGKFLRAVQGAALRLSNTFGIGHPRTIALRASVGVVGSSTYVAPVYPARVLANSPWAYWRVDELSGTSVIDWSGNGHNGIYNGPVGLNQPGLVAGDSAIEVGLTGGWIEGFGDVPTTDAVTIELWVKFATVPGPDLASNTLIQIYTNGVVNISLTLSVSNQTGPTSYPLFVWTLNVFDLIHPTIDHLIGTTTVVPGSIYYVVVTRSVAAGWKLYVNGGEEAVSLSAPWEAGLTSGAIGAVNYDAQAVIDDVALYLSALSAADILLHYQDGLQVAGLVQTYSASGQVLYGGVAVVPVPPIVATTWVGSTNLEQQFWRGVAYAEDQDVVVAMCTIGEVGRAARSIDGGDTWTIEATPFFTGPIDPSPRLGPSYSSVCYAPELGIFVAAAESAPYSSDAYIAISTDGTDWTPRYISGSNYQTIVWAPGFGPGYGTFFAIGTTKIAASEDGGTTWVEEVKPSGMFPAASAFSPQLGRVIVVGYDQGDQLVIITRDNGGVWVAQALGFPADLGAVAWSETLGFFCAVSQAFVLLSPTGLDSTWTRHNIDADLYTFWNAVVAYAGGFVAVGSGGFDNNAMRSTDGIVWTAVTAPVPNWSAVTSAPARHRFIGVGDGAMSTMTLTDILSPTSIQTMRARRDTALAFQASEDESQ